MEASTPALSSQPEPFLCPGGSGFRGLGLRVRGLEFRVRGLEFRV